METSVDQHIRFYNKLSDTIQNAQKITYKHENCTFSFSHFHN